MVVGSARERKALATRTGRRQLLRLRPTASLRPTAVWRKDGATLQISFVARALCQ